MNITIEEQTSFDNQISKKNIPEDPSDVRDDVLHKNRRKYLLIAGGIGLILVMVLIVRFISRRGEEPAGPPTVSVSLAPTPQGGLPVFPGAEGFGTSTSGGRGGKVIEVSSLADSGFGTLREALEAEGPRIIVFRVGGVINITGENLFVRNPYVTVAGQTAPGNGITITGKGITIITHDVVLQHIRVRPGDKGNATPEANDAVEVFDPDVNAAKSFDEIRTIKSEVYNIVLDHMSLSWSEDEVLSIFKGASDVTVSNSIISEALNRARHPKETHSAGVIISGLADRVSMHHTVLAHNDFRNPLIQNGGTHDIRNNVIYDYGVLATELNDGLYQSMPLTVNLVGNTYVTGPSTDPEAKPVVIGDNNAMNKLLYYEGNKLLPTGGTDADLSVFFRFGIDSHYIKGDTLEEKIAWAEDVFFSEMPFLTPSVVTQRAEAAYQAVLASAGATKPKRDVVDARIVSEVRDRTGRIIDSVDDVGGYPIFSPVSWPENYDSDHDGMPDEWERGNGLNATDSSDAYGDADKDGYTNIEEFLHESAR